MYVCMALGRCTHMNAGKFGAQKRVLSPLKLELHVVVSLKSSVRSINVLNRKAFSLFNPTCALKQKKTKSPQLFLIINYKHLCTDHPFYVYIFISFRRCICSRDHYQEIGHFHHVRDILSVLWWSVLSSPVSILRKLLMFCQVRLHLHFVIFERNGILKHWLFNNWLFPFSMIVTVIMTSHI